MTTIIINSNQLMKPTTKRYKALNIIHDQTISKNLDSIFLSFANHKTHKDPTALLLMRKPACGKKLT